MSIRTRGAAVACPAWRCLSPRADGPLIVITHSAAAQGVSHDMRRLRRSAPAKTTTTGRSRCLDQRRPAGGIASPKKNWVHLVFVDVAPPRRIQCQYRGLAEGAIQVAGAPWIIGGIRWIIGGVAAAALARSYSSLTNSPVAKFRRTAHDRCPRDATSHTLRKPVVPWAKR